MFYLIVVGIFVVLFIWEHIARKQSSNFKPSVGLWKLYVPLKIFFLWFGNKVAELSSFYAHLKKLFGTLFDTIIDLLGRFCTTLADLLSRLWNCLTDFIWELYITIKDLLIPLIKICITPLYFLMGYFQTAMTYKYSILVFLGTATISYGFYYVSGYIL